MTLYIATDHAGFELKEKLVLYMRETLGHEVIDCGAASYVPEDDYPEYIKKAVALVSQDPSHVRGIILGGSGQGEAMVANRHPGIRAIVYYGGPLDILKLSREHNNANVLSLGARFLDESQAYTAVQLWLDTPYAHDERHERRIQAIEAYA
jgi:ribose 5-phosphate isomerase B